MPCHDTHHTPDTVVDTCTSIPSILTVASHTAASPGLYVSVYVSVRPTMRSYDGTHNPRTSSQTVRLPLSLGDSSGSGDVSLSTWSTCVSPPEHRTPSRTSSRSARIRSQDRRPNYPVFSPSSILSYIRYIFWGKTNSWSPRSPLSNLEAVRHLGLTGSIESFRLRYRTTSGFEI